jgi:uncharacterized glyoxalase superfamily protein PhnB
MLRALKPFIPAGSDFDRSKAFFCDLGFEVRWEVEGLAELALGGAAFLLQAFESREMQDNLMMAVEVDDLDAWWEHIQASGVLERYPGVRATVPTLFPWGRREVHLIDPAGVCWHFA